MTYLVILKDREGYEITSQIVDGLKEAKRQAKYFLSEDYALFVGTTHENLETYKVEIGDMADGAVVEDYFL